MIKKNHTSLLFNKNLFLQKKTPCFFFSIHRFTINYRNVKLLKKYISEKGRIIPSRVTTISKKKQRILKREIKVARYLGLLFFVNNK